MTVTWDAGTEANTETAATMQALPLVQRVAAEKLRAMMW